MFWVGLVWRECSRAHGLQTHKPGVCVSLVEIAGPQGRSATWPEGHGEGTVDIMRRTKQVLDILNPGKVLRLKS